MLQAMVRDDSVEDMRRKRQPSGVCLNKITCSSLVERIQIQPDSVNRVLRGVKASVAASHIEYASTLGQVPQDFMHAGGAMLPTRSTRQRFRYLPARRDRRSREHSPPGVQVEIVRSSGLAPEAANTPARAPR